MFKYFSKYLKWILESDLLLPFLLFISYLIFLIIARGIIPSGEELIETFGKVYSEYGYQIILLASFLEALILVNLFVPGSFALALGVIFAKDGRLDLPLVVIAAVFGTVLGYILDFILGYYGFSDFLKKLGYNDYLARAKDQLKKFGKRGLILGFIHSNIASFLALTAGTLKLPLPSFIFLALVATLFWGILWSILIYVLGEIFLVIIKKYTFLIILLFIAGMFLMRFWKQEKTK